MEPITTGMALLGVGQILGNVFGNVFGARQQANATRNATNAQSQAMIRAAELQKQAIDEALEYQKQIDEREYRDWLNRDARDYGDFLSREARDRTDWENSERRRAPYRALGDSAVRTLADYIRVPGMRPAQEVPVQQWTHQPYTPATPPPSAGAPTSSTMPVGGETRITPQPSSPGRFVGPARYVSAPRPERRTLADYTRG